MGKLSEDIQALVDRCPACEGSGAYRSSRTGADVICQANMCSDLLTIKRRVRQLEAQVSDKAALSTPSPMALVANPDLAMPKGLSELGQLAYRTIIDTAAEFSLTYTGGCKAFYSPKEWAERGELYGLKPELIIVYDGADIRHLFSLDNDIDNNYAHIDAMQKALERLGLYTEECTCWCSAVYQA